MRGSGSLCERFRRLLRPGMFRQFKKQKVDLTENADNTSTMDKPKKSSGKTVTHMSKSNIVHFPTPIQAESDKKEYHVMRLSNGLIATLISDTPNLIELEACSDDESSVRPSDSENEPESGQESEGNTGSEPGSEPCQGTETKEKMAACALTVEAGSFSDPEQVQGLAHFFEHMVFMGSEKYTKENEFSSYIKRHGGSDNAFTECQYTTYHFECPEKQLFKAMDIFSQFFIKPLLNWDAIDREREAIESEFQEAFPNDSYRKDQLLCSFASEDNPARKFTWGNQYTLRDNVQDEYLHEAVQKYRNTYYSADRMKLAVQARLPIETLKKWVTECFSEVPQLPNSAEPFLPQDNPFDMDKFCRFYYVKSMKDLTEIDVRWVLPPVMRKYKTKPLKYLAFIIGHEGKGSLLSYLKSKLWALSLNAGYMDDGLNSNDMYTIFGIHIVLTDEGRAAMEDVLTATFGYMKMLREQAPDKRLYDEAESLAEVGFRFQEEASAADNTETISQCMLIFPSKDFLRGDELYFEYNPEEISDFLNRMIPSTVNIMFLAKNHQVALNEEEFWFKTKYRSQEIPSQWMDKWNNVEADPAFHLPQKNLFISTDFTLLQHQKVPKYPRKVKSSDLVEIWYKADDKFRLPIGSIDIFILTPKILHSAEFSVLIDLFIKLLGHQLIEELYHAVAADLEWNISTKENGIAVGVYGYNQNLDLLVHKIALGFKNFNENVEEKVLEAFKKLYARSYYNDTLRSGSLAKQIRLMTYLVPYFSSAEKYGHVKSVNLEQIKGLAATLFENVHFQALIQGNLTRKKGIQIVDDFISTVGPQGQPLVHGSFPRGRIKVVPSGEKCFRINSFNLEDKNCVTTVYYQHGPGTIREYVALELFVMIMEEPLFDRLRTQLQLGYDVSATVRETNGILGVSATVRSQINKFTVEHVKDKIDEFVNNFVQTFPEMDDEDFVASQQSLISLKRNVDTYLKEETKRNFEEIRAQDLVFDRLDKEIDFISQLDKNYVSSLIRQIMSPEAHKKLVIQVVGHKGADNTVSNEIPQEDEPVVDSLPENIVLNFLESKDFPKGYFVTNFAEWKAKLPEYPPHKLVR